MEPDIPLKNQDGEKRRAGFELEFTGLELPQAAAFVQSLYGGEVVKKHRYRYEVTGTEWGTFRVELDAQNMRRLAEENAYTSWGIDFSKESPDRSIEDILDRLAKTVVPLEIVMPPVPLDQVGQLDALRDTLQKNKAEGTRASIMHAFGMHINIECPALDAQTLLRYLQAFVLLYPWLLRRHHVDLTRKMTPFVDRFPEDYTLHILNPRYRPDIATLIADYLHYNPTRNRPLDMMPVWALVDPGAVETALDDKKNNPRPAFHYRLPNSQIDDPEWRLAGELGYWMEVERLAAAPDMITKLSRLYLLQNKRPLTPFWDHWIETITILRDLDEQQ